MVTTAYVLVETPRCPLGPLQPLPDLRVWPKEVVAGDGRVGPHAAVLQQGHESCGASRGPAGRRAGSPGHTHSPGRPAPRGGCIPRARLGPHTSPPGLSILGGGHPDASLGPHLHLRGLTHDPQAHELYVLILKPTYPTLRVVGCRPQVPVP